jgi:hypothetical protein
VFLIILWSIIGIIGTGLTIMYMISLRTENHDDF